MPCIGDRREMGKADDMDVRELKPWNDWWVGAQQVGAWDGDPWARDGRAQIRLDE
jgi:hypothetical protein